MAVSYPHPMGYRKRRLPPKLNGDQVVDVRHKLYDEIQALLGAPEDGRVEIVAAHNARARDGDAFFVPAHVANKLNDLSVVLFDVGSKKNAADSQLCNELENWLDSTSSQEARRAVVFITGDAGFSKYVSKAQMKGCTTALIFCEHTVSRALRELFNSSKQLPWSAIVGDQGAAALELRQQRLDAKRIGMHAQQQMIAARGPARSNPHPELEKTELCDHHAAGQACPFEAQYADCWFAHGVHELRPRPGRSTG